VYLCRVFGVVQRSGLPYYLMIFTEIRILKQQQTDSCTTLRGPTGDMSYSRRHTRWI